MENEYQEAIDRLKDREEYTLNETFEYPYKADDQYSKDIDKLQEIVDCYFKSLYTENKFQEALHILAHCPLCSEDYHYCGKEECKHDEYVLTLQEMIDKYFIAQSYPNFENETDINKLRSFIRFLLKGNEQLDKALDKACEILSKSKVNDLCLLDMYVNSLDILDKNVWKDYLLKESEKQ